MQQVKPIIGRIGGKVRLAPWIIQHLKRFQWSIYCEPFAGSAAVYFRLVSEGIFDEIRDRGHHPRVVLNDTDSRIVQLFRTCRDYPEALAHAVKFTPYSREEHRLAQQALPDDLDEVETARRYLVECFQSFGSATQDAREARGRAHCHWGIDITKDHPDRQTRRWSLLPDRIFNATNHLKHCYIENDDAADVMERWATPHTAFYLDPPYVNCEVYYLHNAKDSKATNLDLHHRIAAVANTVEAAAVIVSYYPNDLLEELYPADRWERHHRDTVASLSGITRTSNSKIHPKRTELLLVRKHQGSAPAVNLSGQLSLL